jgi:two-component system, chemotaxis family, chemotaxis protein CheY
MEQALIIDDSRAIRRILGTAMRGLGFEVAEACNGKEALETVKHLGPALKLVLVDWNMPEMNGLEFVTKLRADHRFDSAFIIMVTTETATEQMVKALEAGANEYIMKPFTKDVIEDKLRLLGILN